MEIPPYIPEAAHQKTVNLIGIISNIFLSSSFTL